MYYINVLYKSMYLEHIFILLVPYNLTLIERDIQICSSTFCYRFIRISLLARVISTVYIPQLKQVKTLSLFQT